MLIQDARVRRLHLCLHICSHMTALHQSHLLFCVNKHVNKHCGFITATCCWSRSAPTCPEDVTGSEARAQVSAHLSCTEHRPLTKIKAMKKNFLLKWTWSCLKSQEQNWRQGHFIHCAKLWKTIQTENEKDSWKEEVELVSLKICLQHLYVLSWWRTEDDGGTGRQMCQ